ncbi:hypothetical protein RXV86_03705 [Alisedimentitalea sp. MJ-SS2]|uniref:hypothetical protein n=1 Tax=Aliisedimentitalea sp. MJ-SS2 TaxID=3049795 RepID=UPI002912D6EB|nr:hypothetical protein [Alisedimentitalea sp. MJ-SS2]MDU8926483.1 hypothetical protein [Alisedimentitalea sp. MJ-SS2]
MVWIAAALGVLFGIYQAKKREGKGLDMAQYGAVYGIVFAIIALIINILILRQGG